MQRPSTENNAWFGEHQGELLTGTLTKGLVIQGATMKGPSTESTAATDHKTLTLDSGRVV